MPTRCRQNKFIAPSEGISDRKNVWIFMLNDPSSLFKPTAFMRNGKNGIWYVAHEVILAELEVVRVTFLDIFD